MTHTTGHPAGHRPTQPERSDHRTDPGRPPGPSAHSGPRARQRDRREDHAAGGSGEDLDACIEEIVDRAPPLSTEQRDKLALLLRSHRPG